MANTVRTINLGPCACCGNCQYTIQFNTIWTLSLNGSYGEPGGIDVAVFDKNGQSILYLTNLSINYRSSDLTTFRKDNTNGTYISFWVGDFDPSSVATIAGYAGNHPAFDFTCKYKFAFKESVNGPVCYLCNSNSSDGLYTSSTIHMDGENNTNLFGFLSSGGRSDFYAPSEYFSSRNCTE